VISVTTAEYTEKESIDMSREYGMIAFGVASVYEREVKDLPELVQWLP
jgi:hypothetical protein